MDAVLTSLLELCSRFFRLETDPDVLTLVAEAGLEFVSSGAEEM